MRKIVVINQKGGVGKTTTTANLGVAFSHLKQKTLLVDFDPQAHLTLHLGIDPQNDQPSSYTLLTQNQSIVETRRPIADNLWLIPAHIDLAAAESELVSVIGREKILCEALLHEPFYDLVLIDCPPSLGLLTLNGLCAADEVIIPLQAHFLALQGVGKLLETVRLVQHRINPNLSVRGILLCMHESSTKLGGEVEQDLRNFLSAGQHQQTPWSKARIFETAIRRNIKLAESPSHGLSVFDYAPKSHGAVDYMALANELIAIYRAESNDKPSLKVRLPAIEPQIPPTHSTAQTSPDQLSPALKKPQTRRRISKSTHSDSAAPSAGNEIKPSSSSAIRQFAS